MDVVSHLLGLARPTATLDKRCLLAPSTHMDVVYGTYVAPFHVLLEGKCDLRVRDEVIHLTAGDVVIIPSGAAHSFVTPGDGAVQGIVESPGESFTTTRSQEGAGVIDLFCGHFAFGAGAGTLLFRSLPDPVRISFGDSPETDTMVRSLSALMRAEAESEGDGTAAIMSALCGVLLAMVLRTSSTSGPVLWTAAGDSRIADLVERIVAHPGHDWTIESLAAIARMSRATLMRRFRESTGTTVGGFVARARLIAASELLRTGDQNVAAVAVESGYRSESAFSRAFRDATGMTPARFRRSVRDGE
jgi:AraC-like DNA-binding protein